MPAFSYVAINQAGVLTRGAMEASDASEVIVKLQRQGQIAVRAKPVKRSGPFGGLRLELRRGLQRQLVADFTRELALMLEAGQDLDRALRFFAETAPSRKLLAVVQDLRNTLRNGGSFASALAGHSDSFSRLYIGMVRAGEAGGALAETLGRLAEMLERDRALSATIGSAMIYPGLLTVAAIGSITLLLTEVLPQFVPLFQDTGATLPEATRLLLATGSLVSTYGLAALLAVILLVCAGRLMLRRPGPRMLAEQLLLRLPVIGPLLREVMAARLTRTLGTLLVNGVPLMGSLTIAEAVIGNSVGVAALGEAAAAAREGRGLSEPLEKTGSFPARTTHMLRLGEETGQLGVMALRAAAIHEATVERRVQRLVALLVPLITIVMGLAVAGIIVPLLLAMLSLNDLAE